MMELEDSKQMFFNILFLCVQEQVLLIIQKQGCIVYSGILTSHPEQVSAVLNDKERVYFHVAELVTETSYFTRVRSTPSICDTLSFGNLLKKVLTMFMLCYKL